MDKKLLFYFLILIIFFFVTGYLFLTNTAIFKDPTKKVDIVEAVPTLIELPTPQPLKQVEPKDWKIHTNNREKYSFKYPIYWGLNAVPENGEYIEATTTITDIKSITDKGFTLIEGDIKIDLSKSSTKLSAQNTSNFEKFLNTFVNKDAQNTNINSILYTCSKDIKQEFTLIQNVYECVISKNETGFPSPYQYYYFYKGNTLYSLIVYGKPDSKQLNDLILFKQNLQLLD